MRSSFRLAVVPRATLTAAPGNPSSWARPAQSAALARPSTGGAWTRTLRASPSQPATAVRGAFGITFTGS